jgi:hypothetical protein
VQHFSESPVFAGFGGMARFIVAASYESCARSLKLGVVAGGADAALRMCGG